MLSVNGGVLWWGVKSGKTEIFLRRIKCPEGGNYATDNPVCYEQYSSTPRWKVDFWGNRTDLEPDTD